MSVQNPGHPMHQVPLLAAPLSAWSLDNNMRQETYFRRLQQELDTLKLEITKQSKRNFLLESDVRCLDGRIALLIANRMAMLDIDCSTDVLANAERDLLDDRHLQLYSNLFYLLLTEPRHLATLCLLVSPNELDMFLQTVMFTIYANQYDEFEEHLLLTVFQSVLSTNFKTETNFGTILRANTPISRMMSTYTRRGPGQAYIKVVLAKHIEAVLSPSSENLEIDPVAVYSELVNEGVAPPNAAEPAKHPLVQARIRVRTDKLMHMTEAILEDVFQSVKLAPYGIRWICKQIRCLTRRKDPNVSEDVLSSLIGSFFFLRYLNVAIVSPESYLINGDTCTTYGRRTLVLFAKIIQYLVNNPTQDKGDFAQRFRPFAAAHRAQMVEFLHALCNVGDFYGTLELHHYVDLSKQSKKLHISINELFFMHGLVKKHLDVLAPDKDVHLGEVALELGVPPEQVMRHENYTIELLLFSRWEKAVHDLTSTLMMENNMTPSDILYMETKSLFVQILQLLPRHMHGLSLSALVTEAENSGIKHLEDLGCRASSMLRELKELRVVDETAQKSLMLEEIAAELASLGSANVMTKLVEDQKSLRSVLGALQDHYNYLQSQFDTYKAYLQNVRSSSSAAHVRDLNLGALGMLGCSDRDARSAKMRSPTGVHRYKYEQFAREGIVDSSFIPLDRISQISFHITSPSPGSFLIFVHHTGRADAFMEIDLKLDDILENLQQHRATLDAEYIRFDTQRLYHLLDHLYGLGRKK